jgi:hypothetical protein
MDVKKAINLLKDGQIVGRGVVWLVISFYN